jgi:hypothetical protein
VDEAIVNSIGYAPLEFTTAIARVNNAVKQIFKEFSLGISRENSELWNAFKNLVRGGLQFIPLLGNAALYLYDKARNHFCFHPHIKTALASQNQPLLGIAFDGKVVVSFSLDELAARLGSKIDSPPLRVLYSTWIILLQKTGAQESAQTRLQLAGRLRTWVYEGTARG